MKLSFAFVALAGAVAPPRIELNLEGMTSAYKLTNSIQRSHDLTYTQNNGDSVMSRQDWTEKCAALRKCAAGQKCNTDTSTHWINTDNTNCPFPVARGYDHQDANVDVTTRIYLVDSDGAAATGAVLNSDAEVSFASRATYLFKYDASDAAGNHAEQVVFALILDDTEAPFFKTNCENNQPFQSAITVEAVSDWNLCQLEAFDNVDKANIDATTYTIAYLGRDHSEWTTNYVDCASTTWDNAKMGYFDCNHGSKNSVGDNGLAAGSTYAQAAAYFESPDNGPSHVGKYLVTMTTVDKAGVYGHNAANNVRTEQQAILIRDTEKPTIYLAGNNPEYVECRKSVANNGRSTGTVAGNNWDFEAWTGSESDCRDQLDTVALELYLPVTTTIRGTTTSNVVGDASTSGVYPQSLETRNVGFADAIKVKQTTGNTDYMLDYTCHDFANNAATTVTRTVTTVDTHAPTLTLWHAGSANSGDTHAVVYQVTTDDASTDVTTGTVTDASDVGAIHAAKSDQIWAEDSCDASINTNSVTMSWGPRAFNAKQLGDYVRTYTVSDADNNIATKTRTYTVVDNDVPEITKMPDGCSPTPGCTPGTYEASRDTEYTDTGATCHDFVDGELSHAVEVSGEVVNMRIPGTYEINYDCQDLSGNEAVQKTRTVVIEDTTAPVISILGAQVNYVEAGFPYVDAGATATDSLDGDITQYIWTDGNTVTTQNAFYAQKSCAGIFADNAGGDHPRNGAATTLNGEYYITVQNGGNFVRTLVHCFAATNGDVHTYYHHRAGGLVNCASMGMATATGTTKAAILAYASMLDSSLTAGNLDDYFCTTVSDVATGGAETRAFQASQDTALNGDHNAILNAEQGKYIISFHVEDKAGSAAAVKDRTVIVKDTLPPVITLHLNKKLVHTGKGDQQGIPAIVVAGTPVHSGNMINPAGYLQGSMDASNPAAMAGFGNPHKQDLMAESASTNGWLIGAVASAVAGVALLGFSARKSTTTSVPV